MQKRSMIKLFLLDAFYPLINLWKILITLSNRMPVCQWSYETNYQCKLGRGLGFFFLNLQHFYMKQKILIGVLEISLIYEMLWFCWSCLNLLTSTNGSLSYFNFWMNSDFNFLNTSLDGTLVFKYHLLFQICYILVI